MVVYKDKQYLIFDFEDGNVVKYDFSKKVSIGKSGKEVLNLKSQLSGYTLDEIIDCCSDKNYAKFLQFIKSCSYNHIWNIGTILSRVPSFKEYEQYFSAGLGDCIDYCMRICNFKEVPKGLIKLCKLHNSIKIDDKCVNLYKENPNLFNYAFGKEFISLNDDDIYSIIKKTNSVKIYNEDLNIPEWQRCTYVSKSTINMLTEEYGYTVKALFYYMDQLKTFEALEDVSYILNELYDYAKMMHQINTKFDKYPRNFLTTHKIACRNYNRLKKEFDEKKFVSCINKELESRIGDYIFIYPKNTDEIKQEAVQQNNCVASYIDDVLNGICDVLFLRKKDNPEKSLVTIEVRQEKEDNFLYYKIHQARRKFNDPVSKEEEDIIDRWNSAFYNKAKYEYIAS